MMMVLDDTALVEGVFTVLEVRRLKAILYYSDGAGDLYRKFCRLVPPDPPQALPRPLPLNAAAELDLRLHDLNEQQPVSLAQRREGGPR